MSGRFYYIGLDGAAHGTWNWRVRLFWQKPNGAIERLGSEWISEDGSWSVPINNPGYGGQNLIVHLQIGGGDYLVAVNSIGKPIQLSPDMDENIFAQGPHYDYGSWTINMSESGDDAIFAGGHCDRRTK